MLIRYVGKNEVEHKNGLITEGDEFDIKVEEKNYWFSLNDKIGNKLFIEVPVEIEVEERKLTKKERKELKMVMEKEGK